MSKILTIALLILVLGGCASKKIESPSFVNHPVTPTLELKPIAEFQKTINIKDVAEETMLEHPYFSLRVPKGWRVIQIYNAAGMEAVQISPFPELKHPKVMFLLGRWYKSRHSSMDEAAKQIAANSRQAVSKVILNGQRWIKWQSSPETEALLTISESIEWTASISITDSLLKEKFQPDLDRLVESIKLKKSSSAHL